VQGAVELTVAAAVEPHAVEASGGDRDRGDARLAGVVAVGRETLSARSAADQRRGDDRADAGFGQQLGVQRPDGGGQLALERALGACELADAAQLVARDPRIEVRDTGDRGCRRTSRASRARSATRPGARPR
jgi:hypothetical protein